MELPPTALILPGKPSEERFTSETTPYDHRVGWIAKSIARLTDLGYEVASPDINEPYRGRYQDWADVLDAHAERIDHRSSLTGFSRGASALLHWLSERPDLEVGDVNLVSYWSDPDRKYPGSQGDYKIDETLPERCKVIRFFYSVMDKPVMQSVRPLPLSWLSPEVEYYIFKGSDHMLPYDTFDIPELTGVIGTVPTR